MNQTIDCDSYRFLGH